MREFSLIGKDNIKLYGVCWDKVESPKAAVQLSHGMAEHILRYDGFANYLNERGFIVYGHDHRGHGRSVSSETDLGYFSDSDGWTKLVDDLHEVTNLIKKEHEGLPIVIFGHSMGSFALRHYLTRYGESIDGAIICGTGDNPQWLNKAALQLAKLECKLKSPRHRSKLLTNLSFGSFNKQFKPNKTEFDWLNRDEIEVYKYIEDPLCGVTFTSGFYKDFLGGIIELSKMENIDHIPKEKPYLFISGDADPLSEKGTAIYRVADSFKTVQIQSVEVILYADARHELTNEINKEIIYEDIARWIDEKLGFVHK